MTKLEIRQLQHQDIPKLVLAFSKAKWEKSVSLFDSYLAEQNQNHRIIWIALLEELYAGYITLKWKSEYPPFQAEKIPEIIDFNVLPSFRNVGIGARLLDVAENAARQQSPLVGIGVGLYGDYGSAQRMYVKRGYIPDGCGICYNYKPCKPGELVTLDDDLVLWFTKEFQC